MLKLPQKHQDNKVLLTTLWFTATTTMDGKSYVPEPETSMTSVDVDWQDHLDDEVSRYNEWADERESRPRIAFTKQQVVTITIPKGKTLEKP
jgi:hypothetical protein